MRGSVVHVDGPSGYCGFSQPPIPVATLDEELGSLHGPMRARDQGEMAEAERGAEGQTLLVLEAMKWNHSWGASPGTVREIGSRPVIRLNNQVLVVVVS